MSTFWIIGIGAGWLVFSILLLVFVRPRMGPQRLQLIVNAAGLPLTTEIEPTVVAMLRRGIRAAVVSVAVGIPLATAGMVIAQIQAPGAVFFIDFTAAMLALGVGSAIATVAREDARQRSQMRFARLRSVGVSDYRGALERWAPRVVVALALGAFAFRVIVAPGGRSGTPVFLFVYAAGMVVSLAICEVSSRLLVRRGQPAGSALELAWDDALRSRALNGIALAPMYLGAYFNIASVAFFPLSRSDAAVLSVELSALLEIAFAVGLLTWVIVAAVTKPQQRYLRRLWPELVPAPTSVHAPPAPAAQP